MMTMKSAQEWFDANSDSDDASGQRFWLIGIGAIEDIQKDAAVSELSRILASAIELNDGHDWPISRLIRKRILEIEQS